MKLQNTDESTAFLLNYSFTIGYEIKMAKLFKRTLIYPLQNAQLQNKISLKYCHSLKYSIFAAVTKLIYNVRHRNKSKKDHR